MKTQEILNCGKPFIEVLNLGVGFVFFFSVDFVMYR